MTGAEAAELRKTLGYTQGQLAQLLGTSTPTVSRSEAAREVPEEHAAALRRLPPAPKSEGVRGAYLKRPAPPPVPRKATAPRPAPKARPVQLQAPALAAPKPVDPRPTLPTAPAERVWEAEEIGALLLEVPEASSPLRDRWLRAKEGRQAALIRILASGRRPCPR
ncbi:helix-turn-helix domain-containing protein [Hyalangium minutum]|uniref:HTH cro/C1-type domain-containing protein n=1 Tax=Hyalangium minutum TaxID=394096 RepID=A0A085VXF2_9BACT|nr:hypothetical protein DB31_5986 [Hyalangium minutum]